MLSARCTTAAGISGAAVWALGFWTGGCLVVRISCSECNSFLETLQIPTFSYGTAPT